ncbi:hypothetical protein GF327_04235 [Candidatus Woesearchaeota archaeon]|nr:hypothetical protein [Candidatus Woesearchaeota archaeon]
MKIKKIKKRVRKKFKKRIPKSIRNIVEEAEDFFEEFFEILGKKKKKLKFKKLKKIRLYGTFVAVRPAYVFAERLDNFLKMLFGFSIFISGFISYFWGFPRLSNLLEVLIGTFFGRIIIIVIGLSYFIMGLWKLVHIRQ